EHPAFDPAVAQARSIEQDARDRLAVAPPQGLDRGLHGIRHRLAEFRLDLAPYDLPAQSHPQKRTNRTRRSPLSTIGMVRLDSNSSPSIVNGQSISRRMLSALQLAYAGAPRSLPSRP